LSITPARPREDGAEKHADIEEGALRVPGTLGSREVASR